MLKNALKKVIINAMTAILFICTGNICRSPMAEGLMSRALPSARDGLWEIASAGTHGLEGNRAEPHAVQAMRIYDIDISSHRARQATAEMVARAHWILVMERSHLRWLERHQQNDTGKVHRLTDFGKHPNAGDVPDPYGGTLQTYLHCADLIRRCIEEFTAHLTTRKG